MESQNTSIPCGLNIYFVISQKYDSAEDCNDHMWESYNLCVQHELLPEWIKEKQCLTLKPEKKDVFVIEEFQGDLFNRLQMYKCFRIIGPQCLLSCFLSHEPIPDGNNPVFTTAMRGMVVCASGFQSDIKESIQKKVEYMGGVFTRQLRSSVTHLISDSVMSEKYEKATQLGLPIITNHWVNAIWEANQTSLVKATDPRFDEYKCPVFMNLIATSTNLSRRQKEEVKNLVNSHGGTLMGALDGSKVKVVLAPENTVLSDKLRFAKQNNIPCLKVEWVYKSISAGYAMPFNDYLIQSTKACSTPEKSLAHELINISTISVIPNEQNQKNQVDETMGMTMMTTMSNSSVAESIASDRQSLAPYIQIVERLDVREAKLAGPFLDGCNIYLAGFTSILRDKINRILNAGSATRLDDISDAVTHVLVGDFVKASNDIKLMQSRGLNPYILSLDWLEESLKMKRAAPEECHLYDKKQSSNIKTAEPPSPLSKKNIQMLQRPKRPPVPQFDVDKEMPEENDVDGEEKAKLMKQYLHKTVSDDNDAERSFQELIQPLNSTSKEKSLTKTLKREGNESFGASMTRVTLDPANDSAIPLSQTTVNETILKGYTFLVTGFDNEDGAIVLVNIDALGGRVVSNTFAGIPDFGVVPLTGSQLKHTVNEIVTDLFIEDCIDHEKLVDLKYYHRPHSIPRDAKPLAGCVIATSTYGGIERTYLAKLAALLGATHQDTFARKTNPEKNHQGSTHLLCPSPEGSKYKAAVKWKVPAVTSDWLQACAMKMRLVDETPYLVGETMAPERPETPINTSHMGPPLAPTPRAIITPKRHLPHLQGLSTPGCDTPIINKLLNNVRSKTPQSPYDIATPDTPYGQVFKPNPSPETRKEWVKWVDNFPDLRVDEPPPKRRAPSTPLSELKRQFWDKLQASISTGDQEDPLQNEENSGGATVSRQETTELSPKSSIANVELTEEGTPQSCTPINRKLSFTDDCSPAQTKPIALQLEQLDQVLQATSNTTENRYSLCSGNAKIYNQENIERIDNRMAKDSQPETVGWEEPVHHDRISYMPVEQTLKEEPKKKVEPLRPKFMLSGIKDRMNYENIIKSLGGEVSTETNFDPTATHLLCIRPSRNEKMLGSIAAGKWVLHCTYLRDCEQEGKFIDEERYEWGNPLSKDVIPDPGGDIEKSIAAAVHRWRLKLVDEPGGAFDDMVAMLLVPKEKFDQFERLIRAGGGTVVQAKPPYDSSPGGKRVTHCFIQLNKVEQPVDWAMLASKGILCFLPQYLSDHLTTEKPINPREAVIPEFKKYLALLPK